MSPSRTCKLGWQSGAADSLVKPSAFDKLCARVEALGRRVRGAPGPLHKVGDLRIDCAGRSMMSGERLLKLSSLEHSLLKYLASRRKATVSGIKIED